MVLVFMVLVGAVTIPLLNYASTILRANANVNEHNERIEGVKAAMRMAMADPVELYKYCDSAGVTVGRPVATQGLGIPATTTCYKVDETLAEDPTELRYGNAVTLVGASVPGGASGSAYPGSGGSPADAWVANTTTLPEFEKVWLPNLPVHSLDARGVSGYEMDPAVVSDCRVYFPGTYRDDVTIDERAYFGSGVYYFEGTVRFRSGADVVIGSGTAQGCTTDQDAAFYSLNPPTRHNMSGLGATFVLGGEGRIVIDNTSGSGDLSVVFNQRYVAEEDEHNLPSAGVSIMTVNGRLSGGAGEALTVDDDLYVPLSAIGLPDSPSDPIDQQYLPSTLVHSDPNEGLDPLDPGFDPLATLLGPTPVVEVDATDDDSDVTLVVPGYISTPQGVIEVDADADSNNRISITGGAIAAAVELDVEAGVDFQYGLVNPVVQKVFLLVSESTVGEGSEARSEAVVQINENGAYAVNSWEVQ